MAAVTWLLFLTPSSGGFHDVRTAATAAAFLPALLVVRPWRHAPPWTVAAVGLAAAGGLVALETTRTGWQQADSVADQVLGLLALVLLSAYARTPARRRAVVITLLVALPVAFFLAWKPWWGSRDPNTLMTATFYWHNQLAAYMAALGLIATALAVGAAGRLRVAGLLLAPFAWSVVVLTTSRTSLGLLLLGQVVLLALVWRQPVRWTGLVRWAAVPALAGLLLLVLTSRPFFPHHAWAGPPIAGAGPSSSSIAGDRGADSLTGNGSDRGNWTRAALESWGHAPLVGDGFGSFRFTSPSRVPKSGNLSAFTHDGYAEALASGGLAFGGPLLLAMLLIGVAALRRLLEALRVEARERALYAGTAVGTGVLLVHAGLDFDWHYASLVVLLGVLGGMLVAGRHERVASRLRAVAVGAVLVLCVGVVAVTTLVEHHGRSLTTDGRTHSATELLDAQWPGTSDPRLQEAALRACVDASGHLVVSRSVAQRAVDASSRAAGLEPEIRILRDLVRSKL